MSESRRPARQPPDLNRYLERTEEANRQLRELVMTMVDSMSERIARIEDRDARNDLQRQAVLNELGEMRGLLAEGREQVTKVEERLAEHMRLDRASRIANSLGMAKWLAQLSKWQKGAFIAGGLVALGWAADKGPGMVRFLTHVGSGIATVWRGMSGDG